MSGKAATSKVPGSCAAQARQHCQIQTTGTTGMPPSPPLSYLRALQRHLDVAALEGQVEADALIPHKVQRHLGITLFLQHGRE